MAGPTAREHDAAMTELLDDNRSAARSDLDAGSIDGWVLQEAGGTLLDLMARGDGFFGWSPTELLGDAAPPLVHPDDRPIAAKVRNRVRVEGGSQTLHLRVRARNGRWIWAELEVRAVSSPDGTTGELTTARLRDVSGQYLETEAMALLIDLRQLINSSPTIGVAWQACLERIGRLASFTEAVVWECVHDALARTHRWGGDPSEQHGAPDDTVRREVERVWATGTVTVDRIDDDIVLMPVLAADGVVAVIELTGRRSGTETDSDMNLIVEVAGQLGEAIRNKTAATDLALARQRFELAFSQAAIGMALVGPDGSFIDANEALCRLLDRPHDEIRSLGFQAVTHPDDLEADLAYVLQMLAGEIDTYQLEKRYIRPSGATVWGLLSVSLVRDEAGEPVHFISQIQDITARKHAERELERSVARFRAAFDDSALGMALVALDGEQIGNIVEANDEIQTICSRLGRDLVGTPVADIVAPDADQAFFGDLLSLGPTDQAIRTELPARNSPEEQRWIRLVAAPVRDSGDSGRFAVLQVEDITEERRIQAEVNHLALHDSLTGLPNRVLMLDRIRRAQERSERTGQHVGVLFIDLDNFKDANDTHGHSYGDRLLEGVADRFRAVLRPNDSAARFGGDEFILMCEDLSADPELASAELSAIAARLHQRLAPPMNVDGVDFWVTASIGSHLALGLEESVRSILSNADIAMYQAKSNGRSRTEVYDAAVRARTTERLAVATELRSAIALGQLEMAYQPIIEMPNRQPVGAEALLRWTHPELGAVGPATFIEIAEESDLIVDVGQFVLESVCAALAGPNPPAGYVSMNVSARQLSQSDFVSRVRTALDRWSVDPSRLAIELTESVLVEASSSSRRQLVELRDAGLRIGIDDFGTGYATLRYVKELPVTFLKIDRSFVWGLGTDHGDMMISKAVIGLADALGLDTIAEGVETPEQANILAGLGCPHAQGYLFGRPAPLAR